MSFSSTMAATIPEPDTVSLAAPWWLFWILLLVTFLFHLLAMNLVLGGTLFAAFSRLKSSSGYGVEAKKLSGYLSKFLPVLVAAAITFGVAPLLFVQVLYGRVLYTSSILMGWYWLLVIPLLITAYYSLYLVAFKNDSVDSRTTTLSWVAAATLGLIAFIYTNNMSLMLRPETFLERYIAESRGFTLNLGDLTLIPRYLHVVLGAIAVTGMGLLLFGHSRTASDRPFANWAVRKGGTVFIIVTAVNFIVGTWFLLSYDREILLEFMKSNPLGVVALASGLVFGLTAIGLAAIGIQGDHVSPFRYGAVVSLLLTIASMVLLRDQMRATILTQYMEPVQWTNPQSGAILIFLGLLVGGVATVVWMARALHRGS
jgi:hypothetical protein